MIKQIEGRVNEAKAAAYLSKYTILDRLSLISEPVYGEVLRGKQTITQEMWYLLWNRFLELEPIIIYCRPHSKRILEFGERGQMDGVIDNAPSLLGAYDALMTRITQDMVLVPDNPHFTFRLYNYDYDPDADTLWESLLVK
mgnify:CR=1 FL=1